jgi:hypothetical protein
LPVRLSPIIVNSVLKCRFFSSGLSVGFNLVSRQYLNLV